MIKICFLSVINVQNQEESKKKTSVLRNVQLRPTFAKQVSIPFERCVLNIRKTWPHKQTGTTTIRFIQKCNSVRVPEKGKHAGYFYFIKIPPVPSFRMCMQPVPKHGFERISSHAQMEGTRYRMSLCYIISSPSL